MSKSKIAALTLGLASAVAGAADDRLDVRKALMAFTQQAVAEVHETLLRPQFLMPEAVPLAPELREAGARMAAEHRQRISALLAQWLEEEWARRGEASPPNERVEARAINELALWGRDSAGAADDQRLAWLMAAGQACVSGDSRFPWMQRLLRIQTLPQAQWTAALADEQTLLERWGSRRDIATEPAPTAAALRERLNTVDAAQAAAWPPKVRGWLRAGEAAGDPMVGSTDLRCRLSQAAGVSAGQLRMATALNAADVLQVDPRQLWRPGNSDDDYPFGAARYGVTGVVTVEAEVDDQGRAQAPRVIGRDIHVRGIRDTPPWAFEQALDASSLALAQRLTWRASTSPGGAARTGQRDFAWVLDKPCDAQKQDCPVNVTIDRIEVEVLK